MRPFLPNMNERQAQYEQPTSSQHQVSSGAAAQVNHQGGHARNVLNVEFAQEKRQAQFRVVGCLPVTTDEG